MDVTLQSHAFVQTRSLTYFLLTHTQDSILLLVSLIQTLPFIHSICLCLCHTHIHLHPPLHQWSSQSLPLTSQQVVFHLTQIALVCHPKLCLQSCLPTPLQHIAHLIGLRTLFWICKRRSCIIIRDIQMKDSALIDICGCAGKDGVTLED